MVVELTKSEVKASRFLPLKKIHFFLKILFFLIFNRMKVLFVIFRQSSGPSTFSDLFSAKPAAHSQRRGAAITAKREEFIKIVDGDNHTIRRSYHHTVYLTITPSYYMTIIPSYYPKINVYQWLWLHFLCQLAHLAYMWVSLEIDLSESESPLQ